jgi:hypothetical protein
MLRKQKVRQKLPGHEVKIMYKRRRKNTFIATAFFVGEATTHAADWTPTSIDKK